MDERTKNEIARRTLLYGVFGFLGLTTVVAVAVGIYVIIKRQRIEEKPIRSISTGHIDTQKEMVEIRKKYAGRKELTTPKIYITVPSYRDPELCVTLEDAFEKAMCPERIFVGVVEQNSSDDPPTAHAANARVPPDHVRIHSMNYKKAQGPTYARHILETMHKDEEWVLMLDSHIRFEPGYDVLLMEMVMQAPRPKRTVLTVYPQGYTRDNKDGEISYKIGTRRNHRVNRFLKFGKENFPLFQSIASGRRGTPSPPLNAFFAAGYAFMHSDAIKLAPYSPNTPGAFMGEETLQAAKYWTHGFDLRSPNFTVIYHLYDRNYRPLVWNDNKLKNKKEASVKWIHDILSERIHDSVYGLGKVRKIQDFWKLQGVDYENQRVLRPPQRWTPPKDYKPLVDEFCRSEKACRETL